MSLKYCSNMTRIGFAGLILAVAACSDKQPVPAESTVAAPEAAAPTSDAVAAATAEPAVEMGPAIPKDLLASPAQSGGECGIEASADTPQGAELTLSRSHPAYVEGWALNRDGSVPSSVYFKLASEGETSYFAPVVMVKRPGLGIRLSDESRDDAGFKGTFDLQHVAAGNYVVQIAQRVGDKVLLCATGRAAKVID